MSQTPAGWYPAEEGRIRWWDGAAWTEHYQDQVVAPPVVAAPAEVVPVVETPVVVEPVEAAPVEVVPVAVAPVEDAPIVVEPVIAEPIIAESIVAEPVVVDEVVVEPAAPVDGPAAAPAVIPPAAVAPAAGAPPVFSASAVDPASAFRAPVDVPAAAPAPSYAPAPAQAVAAPGGVPPIPSPGVIPPYAAAAQTPTGAGGGLPPQPPKRSLTWLWFLLGGIALLFVIGVIVVVAVIVPLVLSAANPNSGPTTPIAIETSSPIDPADPADGSFTADELALIAEVQEKFFDYDLTDDDIVSIGTYACEIAAAEDPVQVDDLVNFSTEVILAFRSEEFAAASSDEQFNMIINVSILGEIATEHLCDQYYQSWWDAVEELTTNTTVEG